MKPEKKAIILSDEEKIVHQILKENSPLGLSIIKEKSALSGKKWDAAIKGLTGKKLAKVYKEGEDLMVSLEG